MSLLGRIFLLLLALVLTLVTALAIAGTMGWIPATQFSFAGTHFALTPLTITWVSKVLWWLIALPLVLISALLVLVAFSRSGSAQIYLNRTSAGLALGGDELSVSRRGMAALVVYEAQKVKGVLQAQSNVRLRRKGWVIDLDLGLVPGAAIPEVVPLVHEAVGESMLHHTGVGVDKVRVRVHFGSAGNRKKRVD